MTVSIRVIISFSCCVDRLIICIQQSRNSMLPPYRQHHSAAITTDTTMAYNDDVNGGDRIEADTPLHRRVESLAAVSSSSSSSTSAAPCCHSSSSTSNDDACAVAPSSSPSLKRKTIDAFLYDDFACAPSSSSLESNTTTYIYPSLPSAPRPQWQFYIKTAFAAELGQTGTVELRTIQSNATPAYEPAMYSSSSSTVHMDATIGLRRSNHYLARLHQSNIAQQQRVIALSAESHDDDDDDCAELTSAAWTTAQVPNKKQQRNEALVSRRDPDWLERYDAKERELMGILTASAHKYASPATYRWLHHTVSESDRQSMRHTAAKRASSVAAAAASMTPFAIDAGDAPPAYSLTDEAE